MGPERTKAQVWITWNQLTVIFGPCRLPENTTEILEATWMHWIAFEIEVEIARIRHRQAIETKSRFKGYDFVNTSVSGRAFLLEASLLCQSPKGIWAYPCHTCFT